MKKLRFILPAAALSLVYLASCGGGTQDQQTDHHNHEMDAHHGDADGHHGAHAAVPEGTDPKNIDPICNMVRDETWTDYLVYNTDSVWFCSEFCKDAFAANPEKYRP